MTALFGWLGTALSGLLGSLFGGWRTWVGAVAIKLLLVVVLYNLVVTVIGEVLSWVAGKIQGIDMPDALGSTLNVGDMSSLAGWLVDIMKIPECFAFMVSVIILKWSLRKIPLIRW